MGIFGTLVNRDEEEVQSEQAMEGRTPNFGGFLLILPLPKTMYPPFGFFKLAPRDKTGHNCKIYFSTLTLTPTLPMRAIY